MKNLFYIVCWIVRKCHWHGWTIEQVWSKWGHSSIPNHTMWLVAMKMRNTLPFLGTIWVVFLTKDNLLTFLEASYCITYGFKYVTSFVKKNIPLIQKQDFYVTSNVIAIIINSTIVTSFFTKSNNSNVCSN